MARVIKRTRTVMFIMPDGSETRNMADWDAANAPGVCEAYTVKKFDNGRLRIKITRCNRIENAHIIPEEFRPKFEVEVWNILSTDVEGRPLAEPKVIYDVTESKKFRDLESAKEHYEKLLLEWTDCQLDGSGRLCEVGNKLAPPPPDAPTIAEDNPLSAAVGSW